MAIPLACVGWQTLARIGAKKSELRLP